MIMNRMTIIMGILCTCIAPMHTTMAEADFGTHGVWTPMTEIAIETLEPMIARLQANSPSTLRQPTILAYQAALFLAMGSENKPTNGKRQRIDANFTGGEELFTRTEVIVDFMGYADDSLYGERFVVQMNVDQEGLWLVSQIKRSGFGRGDHH